MPRYSSGRHAYGMCQVCGWKYRYRQLRKRWDGLLVCPTDYEEKHPQLEPRRRLLDAQALKNPSPDLDDDGGVSGQLKDIIPMTFGDV